MSDWQDISDILTPEGRAKLRVGQVLVFNYEGSRNEYKIVRKLNGKVWVKPATLLTEAEFRAELKRRAA